MNMFWNVLLFNTAFAVQTKSEIDEYKFQYQNQFQILKPSPTLDPARAASPVIPVKDPNENSVQENDEKKELDIIIVKQPDADKQENVNDAVDNYERANDQSDLIDTLTEQKAEAERDRNYLEFLNQGLHRRFQQQHSLLQYHIRMFSQNEMNSNYTIAALQQAYNKEAITREQQFNHLQKEISELKNSKDNDDDNDDDDVKSSYASIAKTPPAIVASTCTSASKSSSSASSKVKNENASSAQVETTTVSKKKKKKGKAKSKNKQNELKIEDLDASNVEYMDGKVSLIHLEAGQKSTSSSDAKKSNKKKKKKKKKAHNDVDSVSKNGGFDDLDAVLEAENAKAKTARVEDLKLQFESYVDKITKGVKNCEAFKKMFIDVGHSFIGGQTESALDFENDKSICDEIRDVLLPKDLLSTSVSDLAKVHNGNVTYQLISNYEKAAFTEAEKMVKTKNKFVLSDAFGIASIAFLTGQKFFQHHPDLKHIPVQQFCARVWGLTQADRFTRLAQLNGGADFIGRFYRFNAEDVDVKEFTNNERKLFPVLKQTLMS